MHTLLNVTKLFNGYKYGLSKDVEYFGIVQKCMHTTESAKIRDLFNSDGRELPTAIKFAPTSMDGPILANLITIDNSLKFMMLKLK